MTKTKTKRTIWTALIIVVALVVAAIFYTQNYETAEVVAPVEDVKAEETIKAADQVVENTDKVVSDQAETDTRTNTLEYISKYQTTKNGFNALGVSWEELNSKATDVTFYIRVKKDGIETEWFRVDKVLDKTASGTNYYSAETPVLVEGDQYQYKITFKNTKNEIRNVKINIINTEGATETTLFQKLSSSLFGTSEAVAAPTIISRSGWGSGAPNGTKAELASYIARNNLNYSADRLYWAPAHAAKSSKFIVHHTAGQNNPSSPAAAVRAIWVYHTFSKGWGDIGYNYLVDQNGKIYEGRFGGDNVVAGHSAPYNLDEATNSASIGVSVLGDFSTYVPNASIQAGLAKIIGYKSYTLNINPLTTSRFEDKTTYNIAGHKNYTATACPGAALYANLPAIRTLANTEKNKYGHTVGGFAIDNSTPIVGQNITGTFTIKNTRNTTSTLESLKIVGRRSGVNEDFSSASGVVLAPLGQAGDSYTYTKAKIINTAGTYDFYIQYKEGGSWINPVASSGTIRTSVVAYSSVANVKMSKSVNHIAEFPVATQKTAASMTLINSGGQPKTYEEIRYITDRNGVRTNYGSLYNITVPGSSSKVVTHEIMLDKANYVMRANYRENGEWASFVLNSGVLDVTSFSVFGTAANPKLTKSLVLSDSNILSGNPIAASFEVSASGEQPVRFEELRIAVLRDGKYRQDYESLKDVVLCPSSSSASYCTNKTKVSYNKTQTFATAGSYNTWVEGKVEGSWQKISANLGVFSTAKASVADINYNKIVLKIFSTNDTTPAIGQPTTVNYRINNYNSYPVTLSRVKVVGRLSNGANVDFPGYSNVTIGANKYVNFSERKIITSYLNHNYHVGYSYAGSWRTPVAAVKNSIVASPYLPNIKVTGSMIVNPNSGVAGSEFVATFRLKNYERGTIYVNSVKAADRVGTVNGDYPGVNIGIAPGATYSYSQARIQDASGSHRAFVAFRFYNGSWARVSSAPGTSSVKTYMVNKPGKLFVDTVNYTGNLLLPSLSGKVGREQHLYLNSSEKNLGRTTASATLHYSNSGTPSYAQNGMAGGYGAFGAINSYLLPTNDERYYITMRWNYVTWYEGTLGVADQMYCGSTYETYSKSYYNSYKNSSGQYCVPKTYTKNYNSGMQKEYNRKKVLVTNTKGTTTVTDDKKVIVSVLESGPAIWTGRVSGLSPEAIYSIGASTGTNLIYEWANQSATLGAVN